MTLRSAIPLLLFIMLAAALFTGLYLDPRLIPSALIDKPAPTLDLPPLPGKEPGFIATDLAGDTGQCLGVLVRPMPDRASTIDATGGIEKNPHGGHQSQRHRIQRA